jgi:antitoxin component of RelBE/YafQ-DinJ toxin-antitoxin module
LLHVNLVTAYNPQGVLSSDALAMLARLISQDGVPLSVTSLGSPYVLPRFEGAQALLCSYSACDAAVQATLRVLLGQAATRGRLPVELLSPA